MMTTIRILAATVIVTAYVRKPIYIGKNISIKRQYLMHKKIKKKSLLYHIYLYFIMWTKLNYMLKYFILIEIIKRIYLIHTKKN